MFAQFLQRGMHAYRHTVVHHVQVGFLEIDNPRSGRIFHVGVPDVPLSGHRPIEDLRTGRDFIYSQRDEASEPTQSLPSTRPGDTATERKEFSDQAMELLSDPVAMRDCGRRRGIHRNRA